MSRKARVGSIPTLGTFSRISCSENTDGEVCRADLRGQARVRVATPIAASHSEFS